MLHGICPQVNTTPHKIREGGGAKDEDKGSRGGDTA